MYHQITTKCNMACAHCCFSCEPGKGEDMPLETFVQSLETFESESITIGGGEPTCHPKFWDIMIQALAHAEHVWLATNGKDRDTAIMLARLASKGVLSCELSVDSYHESVDIDVINAFSRSGWIEIKGKNGIYVNNEKGIGIRNVSDRVKKSGRAIETNTWIEENKDDCACDGGIIQPDGKVRWCACEGAPIIGDVWNGISKDYGDKLSEYECYSRYLRECE